MDNFNLKKFLVENKLTTSSRLLREEDVQSSLEKEIQRVANSEVTSDVTDRNSKMALAAEIIYDKYRAKGDEDRADLAKSIMRHYSGLLREEDHEDDFDPDHEAELARGGDSKYDGYVSADMGGDPDMYEEEKVHEEEDDYVNPGNTPDQAKDREEYIEKFGEKSPGEVQEGESVSKYLSLEGAEAIIKELEKDSSKAYMEAKMSKLKEVIETLENKCSSLEESEDAAFMSTSKLKEMKSTAKKLRKYEEKMVKEYDKKYADKK